MAEVVSRDLGRDLKSLCRTDTLPSHPASHGKKFGWTEGDSPQSDPQYARAVSNENMSGQISRKTKKKDFTLEGKKTPIWTKPGNFTNSELTITPKKKSSHSLTSSRSHRHAQRPLTTPSGTDLDSHLGSSINMSDSLYRKSVTFDGDALRDTLQTEVDQKYAEVLAGTGFKELNDSGVGSMNGTLYSSMNGMLRSSPITAPPAAADATPWFTRRYHHSAVPCVSTGGASSPDPPLGSIGVALASSVNVLPSSDSQETLATLARDFFPVTLNAATFAKSIDTPVLTHLPSSTHTARGLPGPSSTSLPWKPPKRSRSPRRVAKEAWGAGGSGNPSSSTVSPPGLASQSLEKMYLRSTEAPATAAASVVSVSPFQVELARLRMERLKLEEEHLLEIKREEELERIRGPQPKWYELKTPEFHYEAHKNTELLRSEAEWQSLMDYRTQLVSASKDFHKTFLTS